MFRLLFLVLLFSGTAHAAPQISYEYTGNGSSEACASGMTQVEHDDLWVRVLQELEFAGYKVQEGSNPDGREFTNGLYFLFLSKEKDGFCVTYKDAYQPKIPALYNGDQ